MQFVKIADMCLIREKFEPLRNVIFLAILGNSMVIEIYGNNIRVSQGFQDCQLLTCVAESQIDVGPSRLVYSICKILRRQIVGFCWSYQITRKNYSFMAQFRISLKCIHLHVELVHVISDPRFTPPQIRSVYINVGYQYYRQEP